MHNLHICKYYVTIAYIFAKYLNRWNKYIKGLLKAELVKRGLTIDDLTDLLNQNGINETRSSVHSKISRGTFSAAFLLQCLNVIGCKNFDVEIPEQTFFEKDFRFTSWQKKLDF